MAKTVWKYVLKAADATIDVPAGSRVLTVHEQFGEICVWVEVSHPTTEARELKFFGVYGTGHNMPDEPGTYVGTVHLGGGSLVFHVYEFVPLNT